MDHSLIIAFAMVIAVAIVYLVGFALLTFTRHGGSHDHLAFDDDDASWEPRKRKNPKSPSRRAPRPSPLASMAESTLV